MALRGAKNNYWRWVTVMFDSSFVEQVRDRNDLVSAIGDAVKLRKAGKDYIGLCPFHSEKSPSFTVSASKQFYHCFGCGAHGNVISWEMEYGGLGFVDAVEKLSRSAGLVMPEQAAQSPESIAQRQHLIGLRGVLSRASLVFQQNLRAAPDAIAYLRDERGVEGVTAKRFGLGYASSGIEQALADIAREQLVEAGLLAVSEDGKAVRDRFYNRVMFPICNEQGETVGFGGRVLDAREPKYLNSAESDVFHKGQELYGLHLARTAIRQSRVALVVEGYMDVVMLHQHGDERAVAALGTSLTEQQAVRLFRLADEVVFVFDGDKAGRSASDRAARIALEVIPEGKRASFVTLPQEHDPDSYVKEYGIDAWRAFVVERGLPLSRKVIALLSDGRDLSLPEDRASVAREASDLLATMRHARLFQSSLASEIAQLTGIHPKITRIPQQQPARSESLPKPDPARASFYRQYALLRALDADAAACVPPELLDEFAAMVSAWYDCAPTALQERIVACTSIRDSALRRVIVSSLEGVRERAQFMNAVQLSAEVEAITQVIQEDLARREREREAVALFA